jgi:tRNA-splicing endonuclease subunit Sen2
MTLQEIWHAFQTCELPPVVSDPALEFDNPFLVKYAAYHHYRSLGWVVKGGIKFCVDYLLYKKGPVFTHAE